MGDDGLHQYENRLGRIELKQLCLFFRCNTCLQRDGCIAVILQPHTGTAFNHLIKGLVFHIHIQKEFKLAAGQAYMLNHDRLVIHMAQPLQIYNVILRRKLQLFHDGRIGLLPVHAQHMGIGVDIVLMAEHGKAFKCIQA